MLCRKRSSFGRYLLVKQADWEETEDALDRITKEDPDKAEANLKDRKWPNDKNPTVLLCCLLSIGRQVPLSNARRENMRVEIKGMFIRYEASCIWFPLNPHDLNNPLICEFAWMEIAPNWSLADK